MLKFEDISESLIMYDGLLWLTEKYGGDSSIHCRALSREAIGNRYGDINKIYHILDYWYLHKEHLPKVTKICDIEALDKALRSKINDTTT